MKFEQIVNQLKARNRKQGAALTIDEVIQEFRLPRREALEVLKALEDEGLGRYVVGRGSTRRFKTRIEWFAQPTSVRATEEFPVRMEGTTRQTSALQSSKEYVFPLDDGLDVVLSLPRILARSETDRISNALARVLVRAGGLGT